MPKFGWCMTGHHKNCPGKLPQFQCSCECHTKDDPKIEQEKNIDH